MALDLTTLPVETEAERLVLSDMMEEVSANIPAAMRIKAAKTPELARLHVKYPKASQVMTKATKRHGVSHPSEPVEGHFFYLVPGESVVLFGETERWEKNAKTGALERKTYAYEKVYRIGDLAEADSYNLSYYGEITSIGNKTVTIRRYQDRKYRLDIHTFDWRNYKFDVEKAARRNSEWTD